MPTTSISALFKTPARFLRSTHIERDFDDPAVLEGYIPTPHVKQTLVQLASALRSGSGRRAWRITGDYGTGKSSFGLALAHFFAGNDEWLDPELQNAVDFSGWEEPRPRLLPVLLTGSREGIAVALLRSLKRTLSGIKATETQQHLLRCANALLEVSEVTSPKQGVPRGSASKEANLEAEALRLLEETSRYAAAADEATGLLVILDELGKFLEHAALYPEKHDIHFLQELAEAAMRSGKAPLVVVGFLHQGFHAYAEALTRSTQKEWEKIAGRYEELLFDQPLEQVVDLAVGALGTRIDALPKAVHEEAQHAMEAAVQLGWYGAGAGLEGLRAQATKLYPLHPAVLPVLIRITKRFAQNERSLFSFLLSSEPFALQDFAARSVGQGTFYRLHHLYDYVAATYGHRISAQSYRSHWVQISTLIDSFPADKEEELAVLKTVGLLNLLNSDHFLATEKAIEASVADEETGVASIQALRQRGVLYNRGVRGGYCLWPHSSVDLESVFWKAREIVGPIEHVSVHLADDFQARPIVARRHYIKTGNLRYFEVRYAPLRTLPKWLKKPTSADGLILIALCDTEEERQAAQQFAASETMIDRPDVLLAVPRPLGGLRDLIEEALTWKYVQENTPEINHDAYAAEEVSRQVEASRSALNRRLQYYVGLERWSVAGEIQWFRAGELLAISDSREFLTHLSDICREVYQAAPRVTNELVNRNKFSSAAAAARMRLIEGIIDHPAEPFVGIDPNSYPPEKGLYLSLLKAGGLHRMRGDGLYEFAIPEEIDPCCLRPTFERLQILMEEAPRGRVQVSELFDALQKAPYGIRQGLLPILLAVFAKVHEQDVAFYEEDGFVRHLTPAHFQRLMKQPERFEVQYCKVTGIRADVYEKLLHAVGAEVPDRTILDLLEVVRPLTQFVAGLPAYSLQTTQLDEVALAVRSTILEAKEPAPLLFQDLPKACKVTPFETVEAGNSATRNAETFIAALREALEALRAAYPDLRSRIAQALRLAFDVGEGSHEALREALRHRAKPVFVAVRERDLKALCGRLIDEHLQLERWLESLAAFVAVKPPDKWKDEDEKLYVTRLGELAQQFMRVESAVFESGTSIGREALRIGVTQDSGEEIVRVLVVEEHEQADLKKAEENLEELMSGMSRLELVAVAKVLGRLLKKDRKQQTRKWRV